jgi:hypothetical protein
MADELLTTRQVMARLGVKHPDKVLELVHAKLLPAVNLNPTGSVLLGDFTLPTLMRFYRPAVSALCR